MATTSVLKDSGKPLRRSSRIKEAVRVTISGVDSYRGPYCEDVSTVLVSAHGCKYESKRDVFANSRVTLEIKDEKHKGKAVSARGLVKWVNRPLDPSGFFETAIELENPGNIWGIAAPPTDWLPFCHTQPIADSSDPTKAKSATAAKPQLPAAIIHEDKPSKGNGTGGMKTTGSSIQESNVQRSGEGKPERSAQRRTETVTDTSTKSPIGQRMGELQREMEKTLIEAASEAVRDHVATSIEDVREELRSEAKKILADAAASQTAQYAEQSLKHMKQAMQDGAKSLHAEWAKRVESDLNAAFGKIEARNRELDATAQSVSASAIERFQRTLETARKDAVDRVVSRLKEQSAPVVENVKEVLGELTTQKEELEKTIEQSLEKSLSRIEESCTSMQKHFEMVVQERLDTAREELDRAMKSATSTAIQNLSASTEQQESEARARLQDSLEPVIAAALNDLKERAGGTSQQFADELKGYSQSHLEFVSTAISNLAKGIANISKG